MNDVIKEASPEEEKQFINAIENALKTENTSKLVKWKNAPKAKDLLADYSKALPAHNAQKAKINKWLNLINPQPLKENYAKARSGVAPKTIRRMLEWRYTALANAFLNEKNLFKVSAQSPKYINAAMQNSVVLNYQFNNLIDKTRFVDSLVRTLVNEGTAFVRVAWETASHIVTETKKEYEYIEANEEAISIMQAWQQEITEEMNNSGISDYKDTVTYSNLDELSRESLKASFELEKYVIAHDTGNTFTVEKEEQVKNRPVLKVIDNASIVVDPTCGDDFTKAKFCIYTYKTNLSELRQIEKAVPGTYDLSIITKDNKDTASSEPVDIINSLPDSVFIDADHMVEATKTLSGFDFEDAPKKEVTIHEYWGYWDTDSTGIVQPIMVQICNNKIIRLERNPYPDGSFPFVPINYLPTKDSIYGETDCELIEDNQKIIQALTRSVIDLNMRSAQGQTAIPKNFLDSANFNRFINGEDYQYNSEGGAIHPAEAIYTHKGNEIPASIVGYMQSQYAEMEAATGIKTFQQGIDGNAYGQAVKGMQHAVSAITQRESDIIARICQGFKAIGSKIIKMNAEWLDQEEVVTITDTNYVTIKRDELKGDFFLSVEVKSKNESEGLIQQLSFIAQTLGSDADWQIKKMFYMEIAQLANLDNIALQLKDYEPKPDPIQERLAELETQIKEAQLKKLASEANYYDMRSRFIQVQVDNGELDYVHKQYGVDHERHKDIVRTQAEAQNQGKVAQETLKGMFNMQNNNSIPKKVSPGIPTPNTSPKGLYVAENIGNNNPVNNLGI